MVISKINKEVAFFIGADQDDNQSIIANFFEVFLETMESITSKNLTRVGILENYQRTVTLLDEMIDNGIITNTDSEKLEQKVMMKQTVESGGSFFGSLMRSAAEGVRSAVRGGK